MCECVEQRTTTTLYYRLIKGKARFIHLLLVDLSVLLGQLGDVTPAACPGSSQQAEHETHPKGKLQGPCQPARVHARPNIYAVLTIHRHIRHITGS